MLKKFSDAAARFADRGKFPAQDLLPLIPPNGQVVEGSTIKPEQLGKIPGRYVRGAWAGLTGPWPTNGLSDRDRKLAADWPTENVGLRATDWPAIDCDVNNPEIAAWLTRQIAVHLGVAPKRTRGNSSRCLFVFRRADDTVIRKMQLIFTDTAGEEHKVEVLGAGQQYVINGLHPSGVAYEWQDDLHLADITADGLLVVTDTQLREFMEHLAREVEAKGCKVSRLAVGARGAGAQGVGVNVDDMDPIIDKDIALAALRSFQNNEENVPSREQIVSLTASFKACLGRMSEEAYDEYLAWATSEGWADEEYIRQIWDSLTSVRTSPDYLFRFARRFGWRGDAVLDFDVVADPAIVAPAPAIDYHPVTEQEEEQARLRNLAAKLLYLPEQQKWIVRGTGQILSHEALNKYPGLGTTVAPAGAAGSKTAANKLINAGIVTQVAGVTYLPARERLTTWEADGRSGLFFNRWQDTSETLPDTVTPEDVWPWLQHLEYLFPDPEERVVLIQYMAHLVQRRGKKIRWAPLIIGGQGVGKDALLKPVVRFLGHNYSEVGPDRLMERFNSFLERELIVVQEMSRFEKINAYEKLKAMIAGTAGDTVMIERKFEHPYYVPNVCNYLFFSNHDDAIAIEPDDRRFYVLKTDAKPQDPAYYKALIEDFYTGRSGWRKVIRYLMDYPLHGFSTHQCPAMTQAKQEMLDDQQPVYNTWLRDQLSSGVYQGFEVITTSLLYDDVKTDFTLDLPQQERRNIRNAAAIGRALRYCGWHHHPQQAKLDGRPVRFWVRDETQLDTPAPDLRETYITQLQDRRGRRRKEAFE